MKRSNTWFELFVAAVAFAVVASFPAQAQKKKQFSDATNVTVVEVPVTIHDGGEVVRTLTRDAFEITDDRKKQDIIGFEVIDLSSEELKESPQKVPPVARRHFLLMFDMYFTSADSIAKAQQAAADLVLGGSLHPSDLVAVGRYRNQPELMLGFTTDRNQVRQAIEALGRNTNEFAAADPLGLVVGDISEELTPGDSRIDSGGGAFDSDSEFAEQAAASDHIRQGQERDRMVAKIGAMTSSLTGFAQMMARIDGKKYVVFLSEGFDPSVLVGNRLQTSGDLAQQQDRMEAIESGQLYKVDNDDAFGNASAQSALTRMAQAFVEADCMIQAVDVTAQVRAESQSNRESLFMMSKDTGGEVFSNYTDLGDAMGDLLKRTSVTYLLAFQPKNLKLDGEFHKLKIKVDGVPRGAQVNYRPGYYAPVPYDQQNGLLKVIDKQRDLLGGVNGGEIGVSVVAAGYDAPGELSYVPVLIEIDGQSLKAGANDAVATEIYAYAIDDQGSVRDFFARKVGLDVNAGGAAAQNGYKYYGHFDLKPGNYTARVMIRDEARGRVGLSSFDFSVREAGEPHLAAAFFPEQPGLWAMLREEETEQRTDVEFPFLQDDQPFIPAARPRLVSSQSHPISLATYDFGDGALTAEVQLFTDSGEVVAKAGEISIAGSGGAGLARVGGTYKAPKLDSGDYILLLDVKNKSTGKEGRISLDVTVQ